MDIKYSKWVKKSKTGNIISTKLYQFVFENSIEDCASERIKESDKWNP